jgi:predicted phage tail protein
MLRKIKLYGELADFVGHKEFEVKADTLAHAVSFLINNFQGIERFMSPKYYQVKVGDYSINEEEFAHPIGKEDIHFIPVISGAGRGFGKILLGAALIGLAFATGGASFTFAQVPLANAGQITGVAFSGFLGKAAVGLGSFLLLRGVSDMLFPLPEVPNFESSEDPRLSFSFGGTQQTGRAGTPVPIVYGEIFTGSVVISGAIDTEQVQG